HGGSARMTRKGSGCIVVSEKRLLAALRLAERRVALLGLEARGGLVYPLRIDVDTDRAAAYAERGDEMRARAAEGIDHDLARAGPPLQRRGEERDWLRRGVLDALRASLARPHRIVGDRVVPELARLLRRAGAPVQDGLTVREEGRAVETRVVEHHRLVPIELELRRHLRLADEAHELRRGEEREDEATDTHALLEARVEPGQVLVPGHLVASDRFRADAVRWIGNDHTALLGHRGEHPEAVAMHDSPALLAGQHGHDVVVHGHPSLPLGIAVVASSARVTS